VHKSRDETVGGIKTFSSRAIFSTISKEAELTLKQNAYNPATNGQSALSSTCVFAITARTVTNGSFAQIGFYGAPGFTTTRLNCRYYTNASESEESWVEYTVAGTSGSITGRSFKPSNNRLVDLGTSTNKWKSFNGVEPGSLSLPDLNNAVDISGYITDLAGSPNIYSPPANGYIALRSTTANVLGIVENTTGMGSFSRGSNQVLAVYLPVVKNSSISIYAICSSLTHAKFIPCLGNI